MAISIDASQETPKAKGKGHAKGMEVVQIKDIGTFSREQIETFKKVQNLKSCVQLGLDMHKWLTEGGIRLPPAEYHSPVT
ncbi:hypothetical protein P3T76_016453 [Phytophthora citrophthora]|uniref:Uncharacterized protein n=1 Tax=Phytophthora citrophthora TaxID=4793 RepID=A0AAD9LAD2_9STRA|nr:hypothetical protein P3T76_016453 [Phytophthora citrophthora]